jgi:hypothetical protein
VHRITSQLCSVRQSRTRSIVHQHSCSPSAPFLLVQFFSVTTRSFRASGLYASPKNYYGLFPLLLWINGPHHTSCFPCMRHRCNTLGQSSNGIEKYRCRVVPFSTIRLQHDEDIIDELVRVVANHGSCFLAGRCKWLGFSKGLFKEMQPPGLLLPRARQSSSKHDD